MVGGGCCFRVSVNSVVAGITFACVELYVCLCCIVVLVTLCYTGLG